MKSDNDRSPRRRVVITGLGAVAPNGIGIDAYRIALRDGVSGVGAITLFDAEDLECRIAAEVKDLPTEISLTQQEARRVGRAVPLLRVATEEALRGAGVCWPRLSLEEKQSWGVVIGSGGGTPDFTEEQYRRYFSDQLRPGERLQHFQLDARWLVERGLTPLRFSRTEPSDFDGLHQLHRCARLRVQYDSLRSGRSLGQRRRRCDDHARHHARFLCHARGLSFAQP